MKKLLYIPAILLLAACSKPKDKKTELEVKEEMMKELVLNHINRYSQDELPRFHVTFNLR